MKLIRFGPQDGERPGLILPDGRKVDATALGEDYDGAFFESGGPARLKAWADTDAAGAPLVDEEVRLGPPICRPSKLVCIGLNYADHARESGGRPPSEPVIFFKSTSAIVGPNDDVMIPRGATKVDWEVELAVVIGRRASYVERDDALHFVAGYMLHNDYSEREFQLERLGQWVKGKSCDTFAPLGPFLCTPDEFDISQDRALWLQVNGEPRQQGRTADMLFDVPALISRVSSYMTLLPGDVISTGTPAGVGLGMDPPTYLKPGDRVDLGIEGLGSASQQVIPWRPPASEM